MDELPIHQPNSEVPAQALIRRRDLLQSKLDEPALAQTQNLLKAESLIETLLLTGEKLAEASATRLKKRLESGLDKVSGSAIGHLAQEDRLIKASELIEEAAERAVAPEIPLILEVHELTSPLRETAFRNRETKPQFQNARPSPPQHIESKLSELIEWLSADSARELFAAERMALWFGRFLEIAPFERGNFRTAHLMLSYFARVDGFPFVFLRFDEAEEVRGEVESALRFETLPLVLRLSEALARSLSRCEQAVGIVTS